MLNPQILAEIEKNKEGSKFLDNNRSANRPNNNEKHNPTEQEMEIRRYWAKKTLPKKFR